VVDLSPTVVECKFVVLDLDVSSPMVDIGREVVDDITEVVDDINEVKTVDAELEQFLSSYEF